MKRIILAALVGVLLGACDEKPKEKRQQRYKNFQDCVQNMKLMLGDMRVLLRNAPSDTAGVKVLHESEDKFTVSYFTAGERAKITCSKSEGAWISTTTTTKRSKFQDALK